MLHLEQFKRALDIRDIVRVSGVESYFIYTHQLQL